MDTFIKDLFPIILVSITSVGLVLILARFIDEAVLYSITALLSLLCFGLVLYSLFLGSWESMNVATIAASVIIGITTGVLMSPFVKKM